MPLMEGHSLRDRLRAELEERAAREYIGPVAALHVDLCLGDEGLVEESLRRNVEAQTGPGTVCVVLVHELARLLDHPRLRALVRRLTLYAGC